MHGLQRDAENLDSLCNDRREEKKRRATVLPDITDHTLDALIPQPEFVSKPVAISVSVHLSAAATGGRSFSAFSHLTCVLLSSFFEKASYIHYRSVLGNLIPIRSTCFIAQLLESRALLNPVCWTNQHSTDVRLDLPVELHWQVCTLEINRREITAHSPVSSLKKNKTSLFLEEPSELFVQTAFEVLQ